MASESPASTMKALSRRAIWSTRTFSRTAEAMACGSERPGEVSVRD